MVGGQLYTYAAGTSTPQATYTDSTGTTPNTNPIILNSRGEAFVWLTAGQAYKFVLYDANNNLIWSEDQIPGSAFSSPIATNIIPSVTNTYNIGSASFTWANGYFGNAVYINGIPAVTYPQTAAESAASVVPTNLQYQPGDVRRYGADATGSLDSTTAIQTAINVARFAAGANARRVTLQDGTYKISAPLTVYGTFGTDGVTIEGQRARINSTHNGPAITLVAALSGYTSAPQLRLNAYVRGIDFNGPGVSSTSSIGIGIGDTSLSTNVTANVFLYDSLIQNYYLGISTSAGISLWFDKLNCQFNQIGMYLGYNTTVAAGPNNTNITRCTIISNVGPGVVAYNFPNSQIAFTNCDIEGNNTGATQSLTPTAQNCVFSVAGEVSLLGCHLESNAGSDGIYYAGSDSTKTLNIQACEMIDACYNVVNVANGYCVVNGGRIFQNSATNNLYLSGAAPAWSSTVAYYVGAQVSVGGTNYVCIVANTNQTPPNATYWTALAAFTPYAVIHGTETLVTGSIANALWANQGGFAQGASGQGTPGASFVAIAPPSGNAMLAQANTVTRTVNNASATRILYEQFTNGADAAMVSTQAFGWSWYANNTKIFYVGRSGANSIEPGADNTVLCGSGSLAWSGGNTHVAFTVVSDVRTKQDVAPIDDRVLAAWGRVEYAQYRRIADKRDLHVGLIAQRVLDAFAAEGLDAHEFGIIDYDPDQDRYGIRYEEALALECAYLRKRMNG